MRSWRQNIIVSHGGRHGRNARTYRKGTAVDPKAAALIPDSVLGATQTEAPADDRPKPLARGSEPGDHPALKKLSKAVREEQGAPEAEVQDTPPPPPPAPPKEVPPGGPKAGAEGEEKREIPDPTTKRALRGLRKADLEVVAGRHGIEVAEGTKGRTEMLRELLATALNL